MPNLSTTTTTTTTVVVAVAAAAAAVVNCCIAIDIVIAIGNLALILLWRLTDSSQ